jgi:hypothetical protein
MMMRASGTPPKKPYRHHHPTRLLAFLTTQRVISHNVLSSFLILPCELSKQEGENGTTQIKCQTFSNSRYCMLGVRLPIDWF